MSRCISPRSKRRARRSSPLFRETGVERARRSKRSSHDDRDIRFKHIESFSVSWSSSPSSLAIGVTKVQRWRRKRPSPWTWIRCGSPARRSQATYSRCSTHDEARKEEPRAEAGAASVDAELQEDTSGVLFVFRDFDHAQASCARRADGVIDREHTPEEPGRGSRYPHRPERRGAVSSWPYRACSRRVRRPERLHHDVRVAKRITALSNSAIPAIDLSWTRG